MAKQCIFEHFCSLVNQNRAKPWVIVTLQSYKVRRGCDTNCDTGESGVTKVLKTSFIHSGS